MISLRIHGELQSNLSKNWKAGFQSKNLHGVFASEKNTQIKFLLPWCRRAREGESITDNNNILCLWITSMRDQGVSRQSLIDGDVTTKYFTWPKKQHNSRKSAAEGEKYLNLFYFFFRWGHRHKKGKSSGLGGSNNANSVVVIKSRHKGL